MPSSSPLDRPSENANIVERLMPMTLRLALLDDGLQHLPLLVAPELGLLAAADVAGRRPCVERRASNTPPCDVPPSAMRSTHAVAIGACVGATQVSKKT